MKNSNQNIVIIDYGMGNIGSIFNMFKYLGKEVVISSNPKIIENADKLILPGVGNFDKAMHNINSLEICDLIRYKATSNQTPILGICLGMQIMCASSEEGVESGLSLIDGYVKKFEFDDYKLKIPHMGWNTIVINKNSPLLVNLEIDSRFYFVHSYYVNCDDENDILTYTDYGKKFVSSFQKDNIIGVQFHPEKSHKFGISLFKNFIENI